MKNKIAKNDEVRPSWDTIWMNVAHKIASRSVDPRTKVGCLIVSDDNSQVLALGYNGDQQGGPNKVEDDAPGLSGFIHAEENALIKCRYDFHGKKIMYVTVSPCKMCAKKIINGRISEVIYDVEYRDTTSIELLKKAGIVVRKFKS